MPPAAAALVPLTLCKKPEDFSKLQVPRVWKTANPHPNLGTLSSSFHGNSPEKILISGVFQSYVNAFSAFFVFNNSSIDWKLRGIFPHVLTHCLHPLGCRAVPGGMARVVLTALSTSFCRREELKAFPWMKKERETRGAGVELLPGGNAAAPAAPVGTEGWEHKNLLKP